MNKLNTENTVAALLFVYLLIYPFISSEYNIMNMSYFLAMIFLSLSLSLIWGYSGIFSFGQTAFFGVGGYAYAIISMNFNNPNLTLLSFILAILIAGAFAWILGYFMFYGGVNDVFVGLITLCVTLVLATFMAQTAGSQWKIGDVLLGGDNGINNIPSLTFGSVTLYGTNLYYVILIVLIVIYILLRKFGSSKFGYSLIAVRENREKSQMFGYNIPFLQTLVFSLGGVLAGLSGVFYAIWGNYMSPSSMAISAAALPVVLVAAAGRKNVTAAVIFSLIYYMFAQYLSVTGTEYAFVILGFVLLIAILLVPQGIIVTIFNLIDRYVFKKS